MCQDECLDKDEDIMEYWKEMEEKCTWDKFPPGYFPYCNLKDKDNDEF